MSILKSKTHKVPNTMVIFPSKHFIKHVKLKVRTTDDLKNFKLQKVVLSHIKIISWINITKLNVAMENKFRSKRKSWGRKKERN